MFKQNLDEVTQGLDFLKSNFQGLHHQLVLDLTIVMPPSTSFKFVRDEQGHCVMYYRNYSHVRWEVPQRLIKVHVHIVFSCSMCIVRKNPYFYEPKGNKKNVCNFSEVGEKNAKLVLGRKNMAKQLVV